MKKKYFFKKLMSVILAAVTMFSLLTLPAHAIVPGEDAYGGESHIVRYDCITGEIERIDLPNTDIYQNITTHSFLNERELEQVADHADIQAIIGVDERIKICNPNVGQYSGITLIVLIIDSDDDGIEDNFVVGSGFMVSEKVMVTAMHCITQYQSGFAVMETRIYQGVSVAYADYSETNPLDMLDSLPSTYNRLADIEFDDRYFSAATGDERPSYDWCIATLQDSYEGYYFNCAVATSSLINQNLSITGYPLYNALIDDYELFYMYQGSGQVEADGFSPTSFRILADTLKGQSGSPVHNSNYAYGFFTADYDHSADPDDVFGRSYNYCRGFTSDLIYLIDQVKTASEQN